MIYISFFFKLKDYFAIEMIYATKGNITLQIAIEHGKVRIHPVQGAEENSRLLAAIARNEELLAKIELNTSTGLSALEQVIRYFSQKGWLLEEHDASPQRDLDPASSLAG